MLHIADTIVRIAERLGGYEYDAQTVNGECQSCGYQNGSYTYTSYTSSTIQCPNTILKCENGHRATSGVTCNLTTACEGTVSPQYVKCGTFSFYDYKCSNCEATSSSAGVHRYINSYSRNCGY